MMDERNLLTLIVLSLILISLFLPIYDRTNGFHNLIFDDYILTWYDGRSPANFHMVKNIIENGSISFSKGYLIGDIPVENHYDFFEKDGRYYPNFFFFGDYIYTSILYFFSFSSDILHHPALPSSIVQKVQSSIASLIVLLVPPSVF